MSTPVLVTKLFVPPPPQTLVARERLLERLNEGLQRELTLVCAPAGFGKTTLISAWVAGSGRPAAWLSLDEADSDPARFLTYLVSALQTIAPQVGADALAALRSSRAPAPEHVLTTVLNDISSGAEPIVLVLDDYHVVDAPAVDAIVGFLLEHPSPKLHLVISSRQDPDLPIARLRARGRLTELRADDLRFSAEEATSYLNDEMALHLTTADVAALDDRTEGWIAGLQLAAISMKGRDDASGFIRGFAGDHRYVADYLVGEVLARQPDDVRSFLLQTSVLDRMTAGLCDAVTGQHGGGARLAALARDNLFVVALDDQRTWYRYHHLFAEVLRTYLAHERPHEVRELHRRASDWYDANGDPGAAIRHALAAEDFEQAAALLERSAHAMQRDRQEATLLGWFRSLPDEVVTRRPVLNAMYAGTLLAMGELDGVGTRLRDAETALAEPADGDDIAVRRLPASIAVWLSGLALLQGDLDGTVRHARRALDLAEPDDDVRHGSASALLGLATWPTGDLETAYAMYADCVDRLRRAGHVSDVLGCTITLADIRLTQGRLRDANAVLEAALQLAGSSGGAAPRGTADMHVGLSQVALERGDVDGATRHLAQCDELGEPNGLPQNPYRRRVAAAALQEVAGDLDTAVTLLDDAERVYANDFSPKVRPVAAMRARLWIVQGRLDDAARWARERDLSPEDEPEYLREFEHVTLARLLLARRSLDDAVRLLGRLLVAAEDGKRGGTALEVLVLLALAHQARGEPAGALRVLEKALDLGEPEGYVLTFVREGAPMAELLSSAVRRGLSADYARQLLAGIRGAGSSTGGHRLIDPLSDRELDVLRLLATELDGPEIARTLMVSLNTVRTHTKAIYSKLGVNNRRGAVRRAGELELLGRRTG